MSELLSKVAEILKAPEELVQRSAEARAEASGKSVDEVLQSWAGGEAIESSPAAETPVEETPVEEVVEEAPVEEVVEEMEEPEQLNFHQELKKRFIEGGPGFMGIVLLCLILGLAIAIERIIFLNLSESDSDKLTEDVEDLGVISDYELTEHYDDVHLLDDIVSKYPQYTYNEVQLKLFANTDGFIGMGGGSTLLLCLFQKPTIAYYGRRMVEANRKYFWKDDFGNKNIKNYHYMINSNLTPFIDVDGNDMENDYTDFLKLVKETFNETN